MESKTCASLCKNFDYLVYNLLEYYDDCSYLNTLKSSTKGCRKTATLLLDKRS